MRTAQNVAIGALAVAVGVVAWKVFQKPPPPKTNKKLVYVGSGWKWPRPDRFPTEKSFGEALSTLGYGAAVFLPGWEVTSTDTMGTVMMFQVDYTAVREYAFLKSKAQFGTGTEIGPPVVVDGLIGENTIRALIFALDFMENYPDDHWIAYVTDAKNYLKAQKG